MAQVDPKYIKKLQGKEFILYPGLIELANQKGLKGIRTSLIQAPTAENGNCAIVKATVIGKDGEEFDGIGDCDDKNANRMITAHKIRMAETRAKARALRDFTGIDMTAFEELGGDEIEDKPKPVQKAVKQATLKDLVALVKQAGIPNEEMKKRIQAIGKKSSEELTPSEIIILMNDIQQDIEMGAVGNVG